MTLLLKPKEKETKTPLTAIDLISPRFEKIVQKRDERNRLAREQIEKVGVDREKVRGEIVALEEKIASLTAEYKTIRDEQAALEEKVIRENSVTEDDLKAGRVNIHEFFAVGKKNEAIAAEANRTAETKLEKARRAIRELRSKVYELRDRMAAIDEKITQLQAGVALDFYNSLGSLRQELEAAGVGRGGVQTTHFLSQESRNDWAMSSRGAVLWHAKSWTVKSIEEIELLFLDPIIQESHFENLKKIISDLRKVEWSEANISYVPVEWAGHCGGDFWFWFRPKSLPERGKIGGSNE